MRMIIQLAKFLLIKPKVLLIHRDFYTKRDDYDSFILDVIDKNIEDNCMITVLENLELLASFDRVMVMYRGIVKESGKPFDLASNPTSWFNKVVQIKEKADPKLSTRIKQSVEFNLISGKERSSQVF